jgi:two-component system OmpR family response regulator
MENTVQNEGTDVMGQACPNVLPSLVLKSTEGVAVLYACEDLGVANSEAVPLLKEAGYVVQVVKLSTHNARSLVTQGCRVIVMEIEKPDAVGYKICAEIRSLSHLPVMIVLRGDARNDVLRTFDAGADTYVVAPFNSREFLVRLNALLRHHGSHACWSQAARTN